MTEQQEPQPFQKPRMTLDDAVRGSLIDEIAEALGGPGAGDEERRIAGVALDGILAGDTFVSMMLEVMQAHYDVGWSEGIKSTGAEAPEVTVLAAVRAKTLTDFADGIRTTEVLFRRDDGSPVTIVDLMRETAANIRARAGLPDD